MNDSFVCLPKCGKLFLSLCYSFPIKFYIRSSDFITGEEMEFQERNVNSNPEPDGKPRLEHKRLTRPVTPTEAARTTQTRVRKDKERPRRRGPWQPTGVSEETRKESKTPSSKEPIKHICLQTREAQRTPRKRNTATRRGGRVKWPRDTAERRRCQGPDHALHRNTGNQKGGHAEAPVENEVHLELSTPQNGRQCRKTRV